MSEIAKSDLFFFISSIGFIVIAVLTIVLIIYLILATKNFNRMVEKMDNEMENLGDTAQLIVDDIRSSFIYKMLFSPKRRTILKAKFHKDDK